MGNSNSSNSSKNNTNSFGADIPNTQKLTIPNAQKSVTPKASSNFNNNSVQNRQDNDNVNITNFTVEKTPIIFNCVVLSRLAYFTNNHFLKLYLDIFGPIIPVEELKDINNISFSDNRKDILKNADELSDGKAGLEKQKIFKSNNEIKINEIVTDINNTIKAGVDIPPGKKNPPNIQNSDIKFTVAYISIATSNYGGYYILVDTRMPNSIFVIFRGTYSEKSARAYTKLESLVPYYGENKDFGVLRGMGKLLTDVYHSIIESMVYLSEKYLAATIDKNEKIKVFTTGHSLGGGLTTLFANRWAGFQKKTQVIGKQNLYSDPRYKIFDRTICCVAIASPRVLNKKLANDFCDRIKNGKIIYVRLKTRGDPVPALPSDKFGFAHPCSNKDSAISESEISIKGKSPRTYSTDIFQRGNPNKSQNWEQAGKIRAEINPLSHTTYYYINFANGVDLRAFAPGFSQPRKVKGEMKRNKGNTVARFILGVWTNEYKAEENQTRGGRRTVVDVPRLRPDDAAEEAPTLDKNVMTNVKFKQKFIDLSTARMKPKNVKEKGDNVLFDTYIDKSNFEQIFKNMEDITNNDNYNEVSSDFIETITKAGDKRKPYIKISPNAILVKDMEQSEVIEQPQDDNISRETSMDKTQVPPQKGARRTRKLYKKTKKSKKTKKYKKTKKRNY